MGIRSYLQSRVLVKEDQNNNRQKKMQNLSEIQNVFVVVSLKSLDEYDKWKHFFANLSAKKLHIDWIGYLKITDKKQLPELPENILTSYHSNFLGFPKNGQFLKGKFSNTYDLTLDMNFDNVYLLNWIWVQLNSHLRVGSDYKTSMTNYYDLTMSTKDPVNQSKLFIDQVFYFLDKINK